MVLVWMMQLVSPFCQYWLEVVTVRVTLQPVRAIAVATIAARVIMMNFFILLMFLVKVVKKQSISVLFLHMTEFFCNFAAELLLNR